MCRFTSPSIYVQWFRSCCEPSAAIGGNKARGGGDGLRTIDLTGAVFVCLLFQGIYGTCNRDRLDSNAVCRYASDGTNPVGRKICEGEDLRHIFDFGVEQ